MPMNQTIVIKVSCTLLMLSMAAVLVVGWTGGLPGVDLVSVAVVFTGALIGRCVLESRPASDAQQGRAAGERCGGARSSATKS